MNAPVTRRALLGATAAVGAVGLPAIAEAGLPGAGEAHADAALFGLLDRYPATLAAMQEAADRCEALWTAFVEREPDRPAALHVRFGDEFGIDHAFYRLRDGRQVGIYELVDVEKLRGLPPPSRSEWEGQPAPWNPDESVGQWVEVPDKRRIARRAEVLATHDGWWAECQVIKEQLGIPAADEADEQATDALHDLQDAILASVPATFEGLAAKARWAADCLLAPVFAADWHRRVVEDVIALAERGAAS